MRGGCLCGAVRYALKSAPFDAGWCHCRTCQLNSGSPAMAFAAVPPADYVFTKGAELVRTFASSGRAHRAFCSRCGTPLYYLDNKGATIDFSLATLDEPGKVVPGFHVYYESRIPWADACDDLPRHERSRF